jgi:6-phosphofructokinase 1
VLATQLGYEAARCVRLGEFGRMVAMQKGGFTTVPLADVAGGWRAVPSDHALMQAAAGIGIGFGVATH